MGKYRPYWLIGVSLLLAGLVCLDNRDFFVSMFSPEASTLNVDQSSASAPEPANKPAAPAGADIGQAQNVPTLGNPLADLDKIALSNWVERPLFAPSRHRPPPQAAAAVVAAQKPPPEYALVGVILNPSRTVALLRSVSNGANVHVEVGDTLGGWRVASVERNAVTLTRANDVEQVIHFKEACTKDGTSCP